MKILNLTQGSDEWLKARAKYRTASEASAMMGCGSVSRSELVRMKATGDEQEFSRWTKDVLFERGHDVEAAARPLVEAMIGEELFPITGTDDDDYLLASFDGVTMDGSIIWECKQWNADKAACVTLGEMPETDKWQVVQQLVVSGADYCVYTVTDGTSEKMEYLKVTLEDADRDALLAHWKQFDDDVAAYTPAEQTAEVVGRSPDQLPSLLIEVKGEVTASNLSAFKEHAMDVFRGINTDLQTDSHFADAEKAVKWCKEVEGKLDASKEHALAQTASIDELFRAIDSIKEEARSKRLELEKLVKSRKEHIRAEIIAEGRNALAEHVANINVSLKVPVQAPQADFAAAIKGKRTISSLRDAVDTLLAKAKIEASQSADLIRANLQVLSDDAGEFKHLFADYAQLVTRETDYVKAIISLRIAEHEEAEQKRLEAERARIREEEEQKARKAAEAERIAAEREAKRLEAADMKETTAVADEPKIPAPTTARSEPQRPNRPTDVEILQTLADCFRVHESKVLEWLMEVDTEALGSWVEEEFAA